MPEVIQIFNLYKKPRHYLLCRGFSNFRILLGAHAVQNGSERSRFEYLMQQADRIRKEARAKPVKQCAPTGQRVLSELVSLVLAPNPASRYIWIESPARRTEYLTSHLPMSCTMYA
jgi:hypothetical protein